VERACHRIVRCVRFGEEPHARGDALVASCLHAALLTDVVKERFPGQELDDGVLARMMEGVLGRRDDLHAGAAGTVEHEAHAIERRRIVERPHVAIGCREHHADRVALTGEVPSLA
jgi:hypothetical protein